MRGSWRVYILGGLVEASDAGTADCVPADRNDGVVLRLAPLMSAERALRGKVYFFLLH